MTFPARLLLLATVTAMAWGCASAPYTRVAAGPVAVGSMNVTADEGWNASAYTDLKKGGVLWTRDGVLLNRLVLVPDIEAGGTLFEKPPKQAAFPPFRADMLPHEIEALLASWLTKAFGEGDSMVETSGLRPVRYGDARGFAFDLRLELSEGPAYRGLAGGYVTDGKLSLVVFIAATPHYFERDAERIAQLIASVRPAQHG
jgi:hypothetical protein